MLAGCPRDFGFCQILAGMRAKSGADFDRMWPRSAQIRPQFGTTWPISAKLGDRRFRPRPAVIWPTWVESSRIWPMSNFGRPERGHLATIGCILEAPLAHDPADAIPTQIGLGSTQDPPQIDPKSAPKLKCLGGGGKAVDRGGARCRTSIMGSSMAARTSPRRRRLGRCSVFPAPAAKLTTPLDNLRRGVAAALLLENAQT